MSDATHGPRPNGSSSSSSSIAMDNNGNAENTVDQIYTKNSSKQYKICDVLGGLDVTRLVSTNARNFFAAAIDDAELLREYLVEATRYTRNGDSSASGSPLSSHNPDFDSLEAMSRSLDWKARGVPENTTTLDLGLGYTDDRINRRVDRFAGMVNDPLVGDKESDFFMMDGLSTIMPWVVDRRSKPDSWWLDHPIGRSQGDKKVPLVFDILYNGAWLISYADSILYYPPLTVYDHPLTFGDRVGTNFNSHDAPFSKPNFPENNPDRVAKFSDPYPDTAVPGLSLVSAIAPIYYTGSFRGYEYNDTYVASVGLDISMASISSFLDVLTDSLTPGSFAMLVNSDLNTIVISQEVVKRIYPERTGMEEERISYGPDGVTVLNDRRNQTYQPSDTILQGLTKLDNADWTGLMEQANQVAPGVREYTTMDIQLTTTKEPNSPTEFYVMFERWEFVADWTCLVFAPTEGVRDAIDVFLTTDFEEWTRHNATLSASSSASTTASVITEANVTMEGEKGESLQGRVALVNNGNLDILVNTKTLPSWIQLNTDVRAVETYLVAAGEKLPMSFDVTTRDLDIGTQASSIVFDVQDAGYPDCFFRQEISLPVSVRVLDIQCSGASEVANDQGVCVCDSNSLELGGTCVSQLIVAVSIFVPTLFLGLVAVLLYLRHKRRLSDSQWMIDQSELVMSDPEIIIGEGSFGSVILADYRGTQVAVKCIVPPSARNSKGGVRRSVVTGFGMRDSSNNSGGGRHRDILALMEAGTKTISESFSDEYGDKSGSESNGFSERTSITSSNMETVSFRRSSIRRSSVGGGSLDNKAEFAKEMRLLHTLRHPNIVQVLGAVTEKGAAKSIVMEYMEQGSLYDTLQNQTIEIDGEMIISILQDILKGLQFLHYATPQPLIHGDLKAANVLLDASFKAKLTDLSLHTGSQKKHRSGSPFWMSPELLRMETLNTPASDIYALGCVVHEIYARNAPYYGEEPTKVLQMLLDPKVTKRPAQPKTMTTVVAGLMRDMVVSDPAARPSLEEIASRFKRLEISDADPIGMVKKPKGGDNKKDFELLLQVFPRHIAEALRDGRKVEPEKHGMSCRGLLFHVQS